MVAYKCTWDIPSCFEWIGEENDNEPVRRYTGECLGYGPRDFNTNWYAMC